MTAAEAKEKAAKKRRIAAGRARALKHAALSLTPEILESIVVMVSEGNYPTVAAMSLGVPKSTFGGWMERGEEDFLSVMDGGEQSDEDALKLELYLRVTAAEAGLEVDLQRVCRERIDNKEYWQGYMTLLERHWPDRWAQRRQDAYGGERRIEDEIYVYLRGREDANREAAKA